VKGKLLNASVLFTPTVREVMMYY